MPQGIFGGKGLIGKTGKQKGDREIRKGTIDVGVLELLVGGEGGTIAGGKRLVQEGGSTNILV